MSYFFMVISGFMFVIGIAAMTSNRESSVLIPPLMWIASGLFAIAGSM